MLPRGVSSARFSVWPRSPTGTPSPFVSLSPALLVCARSFMCLAQGKDRTPKDKAEFRATLPNINL